ncbi:MAG: ATP synthase subunit C [Treponema sp.]|uniref:ATP synthase subunit C n=1 Tax=Treponema sp. TaxID=166 RepID=UPI00298E65A2|nr:ATP synthase subunit C [Treponema sp.]MCQ2601457.1 ATP synthase subunit C [Treponema sp.]
MNKKFFIVMSVLALFAVAGIFAEGSVNEPATETQVEQQAPQDNAQAFKYIAAGLAVGLACIAGGMAVGKIGAAAMGAMSENAELSGKALPFVGLAEGICLWGFLVALLIIIL